MLRPLQSRLSFPSYFQTGLPGAPGMSAGPDTHGPALPPRSAPSAREDPPSASSTRSFKHLPSSCRGCACAGGGADTAVDKEATESVLTELPLPRAEGTTRRGASSAARETWSGEVCASGGRGAGRPPVAGAGVPGRGTLAGRSKYAQLHGRRIRSEPGPVGRALRPSPRGRSILQVRKHGRVVRT